MLTTPTPRPLPTSDEVRRFVAERYLASGVLDHGRERLAVVAEAFGCDVADVPMIATPDIRDVRAAAIEWHDRDVSRAREEARRWRDAAIADWQLSQDALAVVAAERDAAEARAVKTTLDLDAAIKERDALRAELAALNARVSHLADRAERLGRVHPTPERS